MKYQERMIVRMYYTIGEIAKKLNLNQQELSMPCPMAIL